MARTSGWRWATIRRGVDVLTELLDGAGVEFGACLEARDALAAIDEDPDAWALLI